MKRHPVIAARSFVIKVRKERETADGNRIAAAKHILKDLILLEDITLYERFRK